MNTVNRRLQSIYKKVTGKQVIISTIIFLLFTALVLPFISTYSTQIIGVADSPDTNFKFNLAKLYILVDSYGKDGRLYYVILRWTFDIVWPTVYTVFLVSSIAYLARETKCKFNIKPIYLPVLAVLFDLLENINATIIMLLYPIKMDVFGYLLFASSILKWITIGLSFLLVIGFLIYYIIMRLKD